jgi:hypothetical protein
VAKATAKPSTPSSPPGSTSLAAHFKRLRAPISRHEVILHLTNLFRSGFEIHPPLPREWWLTLDRANQLRVVLADGTVLDADKVFVRERYENPFKPVPLPPAAIAGFGVETKAPPPVITAKEAARLEPEQWQWLRHAVVRFPERKDESRAKYFKRLEGHMRRELQDRVWGQCISGA